MFWQGINADRHKVTQKKLMTLQSLAFHRIMKEVQPELVSKQLVVILTKVKSFQSHHQIVCVYSGAKEQKAYAISSFKPMHTKTSRWTIDYKNYLDDIVLIKFPSAVKNLHFDLIDGMQILGVEEPGNYAETVTLTNIPRYITEIWFDFEYLDTVKGNDFVAAPPSG